MMEHKCDCCVEECAWGNVCEIRKAYKELLKKAEELGLDRKVEIKCKLYHYFDY